MLTVVFEGGGGGEKTTRSPFLLNHYVSSGSQAWWQVPSCAEPALWPFPVFSDCYILIT